jgi:HK97 family phage major capsid protein/HK97 family phage prohead protease
MNRAYSIVAIKATDDDQRVIEGIASTPTPDRAGDVVEPMGAMFKLPLPLLWQHNSREPVGHVEFAKATKEGIPFRARLAQIADPGELKNSIDKAWQAVKAGLVRGVSIGFRDIEYAFMESGGIHFQKWEWLELSLVTIPANHEATITTIKSFDQEQRGALATTAVPARTTTPSALGIRQQLKPPVSAAPRDRGSGKMTTIAEQISAFEAKRSASLSRMDEIQTKAIDEGRTKEETEKEEYRSLQSEVVEIDDELKDLRENQRLKALIAKPVAAVTSPGEASAARDTRLVPVTVRKQLQPGTSFVRYVGALANARGNRFEAAEFAKRWKDETPEVEAILRMPVDLIQKVAVAPGTTTDTTWAAPLVQYTNMASEFIEFLRPMTVLGRMNGFRRVPFKTRVPRQTAGAAVNWVGEGKIKPLTSLAFDSVTLDHHKVAGIIPLSEELVRFSDPSAEALVRTDLAAAIAQFLDDAFLDPANAATDVSPAAVTNGVTPVTSTGTTAAAFRLDIKTMFAALLAANQQISSGVWVMTQQQALALNLMQNSLGQDEFPGITMMGGTLLGFPVITTENLPSFGGSPADGYPIIFVMPSEILMADDGGVTIDMSREASLQMETTPDSPVTASTVTVNLWQHNLIAIKAERFMTWKVRRTTAVGFIQGAKYAE